MVKNLKVSFFEKSLGIDIGKKFTNRQIYSICLRIFVQIYNRSFFNLMLNLAFNRSETKMYGNKINQNFSEVLNRHAKFY